jgi:superfamily II DNA/RNA helicase
MVINWDLPNEPEEYTHRVGRTARAGKGGVAVSFVTEKDEERISQIEARIGTSFYSWSAVIELAHNLFRHPIRGYDHARKQGFRKIECRIHREKASKYGAHVKTEYSSCFLREPLGIA